MEIKLFKKKIDPERDEFFYRTTKIKKRIKRKSLLANTLCVLVIIMSSAGFISSFKKNELNESSLSKQFVEEFIKSYYSYPKTEEDKDMIKKYSVVGTNNYTKNIVAVKVDKIAFNEIESKPITGKEVASEYNMIIYLNIDKDIDGAVVTESQQIYRTLSVIENKKDRLFGVTNISPYATYRSSTANLSDNAYIATETQYNLSDSERKSAETKVLLFLNQYNDSHEKAVELVSGAEVLKNKAEDVNIEFVSLYKATKNKDEDMWYILSNITLVNKDFTESKKLELHLNVSSGRIEKVEVFN